MSPRENVVWISPRATTFSCVCEQCLTSARACATSFLEAVRLANVRGTLELDTDVGFVHCRAGHEIVLRRGAPLPGPARSDERQLQLA
jgi:hypothetical protein